MSSFRWLYASRFYAWTPATGVEGPMYLEDAQQYPPGTLITRSHLTAQWASHEHWNAWAIKASWRELLLIPCLCVAGLGLVCAVLKPSGVPPAATWFWPLVISLTFFALCIPGHPTWPRLPAQGMLGGLFDTPMPPDFTNHPPPDWLAAEIELQKMAPPPVQIPTTVPAARRRLHTPKF